MKYLFGLVLLALCMGCNTNDDGPEDEVMGIDIEAIFNDTETNFIYFEDGDVQYYYPIKRDLPGFSNRYLEDSEQLNLNMRSTEDFQYQCDIYMSIPNFFDLPVPVKVGGTGGAFVGNGELQLLDVINDVDIQFGSLDDYNFVGSSIFNQIEFTITSLENLVFAAEFEGTIATKTGKVIQVDNGLLRVQLEN